MPIAALPLNTVRAIGSTQALSDSASVVKELLDNALDAHASAVCVEISTNALDVIQVKDNGHGIAPEDRGLVCRRFCTNKIRNFEDISNIGGSSLGFRGEALASAAETSGGLTISTRVEGEAVAMCLKFTRPGGILSEEPTSHPVGTTVRIVDFLKHLPVRRQTALKTPTKTFTKIRKTLEAYALARPSTRISLKVLKAKNDKSNWMYAPRIDSSVVDAAAKVFGKKATDQCRWTTWEDLADTSHNQLTTSVPNNKVSMGDTFVDSHERSTRDIFTIQALLPNTNHNYSTINNAGQYVAVDSRPVSGARGTLKHVIDMFKSYVRSGSLTPNTTEPLNNPILCMNIICPTGSYDVNVEPAKDDVLFTDPEKVLQIVEKFFKVVYGDLPTRDARITSKKLLASDPGSFDVMLASRKEREISSSASKVTDFPSSSVEGIAASCQPITLQGEPPDVMFSSIEDDILENALIDIRPNHEPRSKELNCIASPIEKNIPDRPRRGWQPNMYAEEEFNDDDLLVATTRNELHSDDETDAGGDLKSVSVSNPWTIAKTNAPVRRTPYMSSSTDELADGDVQLPTPRRQNGDVEGRPLTMQCSFPNWERSVQAPSTPRPTQKSSPVRSGLLLSSPSPFPFPMKAWGKGEGSSSSSRRRKQVTRNGDGDHLKTWFHQAPDQGRTEHQDEELHYERRFSTDQLRPNGFVSARILPTCTQLSAIPEAPRRPQNKSGQRKQAGGAMNQPFVSPVNGPEPGCFKMTPRCDPKSQQTQLIFAPNNQAPSVFVPSDSEELEPVGETSTVQASQVLARPMHPDLAITMDYERRKQEATRKLREQLRQQAKAQRRSLVEEGEGVSPAENNSPHQNRYNKAIAALAPTSVQEKASQGVTTSFEPGDPRGYLIRCHYRENAGSTNPVERQSKAKGRKTSMLPLETVSKEGNVRELNLTIRTSNLLRMNILSITKHHDDYISTGVYVSGLACAPDDLAIWAERLSHLLKRSYRDENEGEIVDLTIDLSNILSNHLAACA